MGHPVAFCQKDGFFPAGAIQMDGLGSGIAFENVRIDCPKCQQFCEVLPGLYEVTAEGMRLSLSPSISPEAIKALAELARGVQEGRISTEVAQRKAENIAPSAKGLFDFRGMSDGPRAAIISALIAAGAAVGAAATSYRATTRAAEIQASAVVEAAHISAKAQLLSSTAQTPVLQTHPTPRLKPEAPQKKAQSGPPE